MLIDDLFFFFIDAAKRLQPKVVIAENVKGLITGAAKGWVNQIVKAFDEAGYSVQMFLFNAAKMGVPQRREVKESIINAYMAKTGLRHNKIAQLMENETWISAKKALDWGFCDEILFDGKEEGAGEDPEDAGMEMEAHLYSTRQMGLTILNRIKAELPEPEPEEGPPETTDPKPYIGLDGKTENGAMPYMILSRQLDLLR